MKALTTLIAATLTSTLVISGCAMGDDDEYEHRSWGRSSLDVAPVTNTQYQKDCGSCHMAYQPGFLPARSWQQLMTTLDDHFGDNAELDKTSQEQLTQYLVDNAADHANYKRSQSMMRSLTDRDAPLRISKTRYFVRKHDEISTRYVEKNPKVKSFSRCEVCHTEADKGSYNEHDVRIPGYGRWDD